MNLLLILSEWEWELDSQELRQGPRPKRVETRKEGNQEMFGDAQRWSIRRLSGDANIADMDCGDDPWGRSVTEFLLTDALEQQAMLMSKTTLFYFDQNMIGYVTLAASVLELKHADRVRRQPGIGEIGFDLIPSALIARFGVHKGQHRKGHGRRMFSWVLAEVIQSNIGARLLILHVDKDNKGGREFWKGIGFRQGSSARNILMWLDLYEYRAANSK